MLWGVVERLATSLEASVGGIARLTSITSILWEGWMRAHSVLCDSIHEY